MEKKFQERQLVLFIESNSRLYVSPCSLSMQSLTSVADVPKINAPKRGSIMMNLIFALYIYDFIGIVHV